MFLRSVNKDSRGKSKAEFQLQDQDDLGNEDSAISGFHKTGREGERPEAHPSLRAEVAATQFEF